MVKFGLTYFADLFYRYFLLAPWRSTAPLPTAGIGSSDRVVIFLVGCGSVGSFTAQILAQQASRAQASSLDLRLYFVDPAQVKEAHVASHNFCGAEVGQFKAVSLAKRYGEAFNIAITPLTGRFRRTMLQTYRPSHFSSSVTIIIISAVDNPRSRRDIAEALVAWQEGRLGNCSPQDQVWWLDASQALTTGFIAIGNSFETQPQFSSPAAGVFLPFPHLQRPGLFQLSSPAQASREPLAEALKVALSRVMAAWIGVYVQKLIQSQLEMIHTSIDLSAGTVQSKLIARSNSLSRALPQGRSMAGFYLDNNEKGVVSSCPACGSPVNRSYIRQQGVQVGLLSCAQCAYRQVSCPTCWTGQVEICGYEEGGNDLAEIVQTFCCTWCDWMTPIPQQVSPSVLEPIGP